MRIAARPTSGAAASPRTDFRPELANKPFEAARRRGRLRDDIANLVDIRIANSVFGRWALKGDASLGLQDLASAPPHLACDDTRGDVCKAKFSQNCRHRLLISAKYRTLRSARQAHWHSRAVGARQRHAHARRKWRRCCLTLLPLLHGSVCAAPLRLCPPSTTAPTLAMTPSRTMIDAGAFTVALAAHWCLCRGQSSRRGLWCRRADQVGSGAVALREIASLDKSHVCTKGAGLYSLQPTNLDDAACAHSFKFEAQAADKCRRALRAPRRRHPPPLRRLSRRARPLRRARNARNHLGQSARRASTNAAAKQALDVSREPKPFLPSKVTSSPTPPTSTRRHVQRRHRHHYVHVSEL
jgi:hypothetical protein